MVHAWIAERMCILLIHTHGRGCVVTALLEQMSDMEYISVKLLNKETRRMKTHTYSIWSEEEAKSLGMEYVHWKKAHQGEMALSDDGWVGECIYTTKTTINRPKDPTKGYHMVRTVFGYNLNSPGTKLWAKRKNDTSSKKYRETRSKDTVRAYVAMRLEGKGIDWDMLGKMFAPEAGIPRAYAKKFIRSERTISMIRTELQKIMSDSNITPQMILGEYVHLLESCKNPETRRVEDKQIFKETLDTLADMNDLKPDKIEMSANWNMEIPQGVSMEELNAMDQKLLEAKAKELTDGSGKQAGDAEEVQGEHPDVR